MCNVLKFLYLLSKALGIAPFSFYHRNVKPVVSTAAKIHTTAVVLVLLTSFCVEMTLALQSNDFEDGIVKYSDIFSEILGLGAAFAALLCSLALKQKLLDSLFVKIVAVYALLYEGDMKRCIYSASLLWFVVTGTYLLLGVAYGYSFWVFPGIDNFGQLMPSMIVDIVRSGNTLQFFIINLLMREWFKKLNEKFLQVFSICSEEELDLKIATSLGNSFDSYITIPFQKPNAEKNILFSGTKTNVTSVSRFSHNKLSPFASATQESSQNRLTQLRRVYFLLCEISRSVNVVYSIPNLLQLISCIVCGISYTYAFVVNILKLKISTTAYEEEIIILWSFLMVVVNVWWLGSIAYSSEAVRRESRRTGRLVQKLLVLAAPVGRSCSAELQLFAQQLVGRAVRHSAAGLFSLDLSMVKTAVAAAATYLVVLVQFGLSNVGTE